MTIYTFTPIVLPMLVQWSPTQACWSWLAGRWQWNEVLSTCGEHYAASSKAPPLVWGIPAWSSAKSCCCAWMYDSLIGLSPIQLEFHTSMLLYSPNLYTVMAVQWRASASSSKGEYILMSLIWCTSFFKCKFLIEFMLLFSAEHRTIQILSNR